MCFSCEAGTHGADEPNHVGPRPVTTTYTVVTPATVQRGGASSSPLALPNVLVAPRIQTVRPASRSPRASSHSHSYIRRTSQSPKKQSTTTPRHSGASLTALRPLSSHTPPLTPLSTTQHAAPDWPYSLYHQQQRRRYSAVVVIEHQSATEPRIVNARPSHGSRRSSRAGNDSKPSSLRARDSPRTSDQRIAGDNAPVAVTSPRLGSRRDVDMAVAGSSPTTPKFPTRRPSQPRVVHVSSNNGNGNANGNGREDDGTPIRVIRYRSYSRDHSLSRSESQSRGSGQHRRSAASSPRGSGSHVHQTAPHDGSRSSSHVRVSSGTSPLHHAATAPSAPASAASASAPRSPAATTDRAATAQEQQQRDVATSPAALAAGAHATVGEMARRHVVGNGNGAAPRETGNDAADDEVLGSDQGRGPHSPARGTAATPATPMSPTSRVRWDDHKEKLQRRVTTDADTTHLAPTSPRVYHVRRRSSSGAAAAAPADNDAGIGPRTSNVSVRSTQSTRSTHSGKSARRERVVVVDPDTGRAVREYRR